MNDTSGPAKILAAAALLAIGAIASGARAGSGTGTFAAETFVHSRFPNNNNGGCTFVVVGRDGSAGLMHDFVRFTLPGPSMAGRATVTGVLLRKTVGTLPNGAAGTADTYFVEPLTQAFTQGAGCGAAVQGTYLVGTACTAGSTTWNQSACGVTNWTTPGGSVTGTPTASSLNGATLSWDSGSAGATCAANPQLCANVQTWIDTGNAFGWRIRNQEAANGTAQALVKGGTLAFAFSCKAGFKDLGNTCTSCTDAANTACRTSVSGNACNDPGAPSSAFSCTCGAAGFKVGPGGTSCVPACQAGVTCKDAGDAAATCSDTPTGYTCGCDSGFVNTGTTCVPGCNNANPTPFPCGNGGTCNTQDGGNTWTCSCPVGFVSNNAPTGRPACVDLNACDAGANASCVSAQPGNSCVDEPAPSITYHCACGNAAYVLGTVNGQSACVDKNECVPNHCADKGDPAATCVDAVAPATGYSCTCGPGFKFDGVTCVSNCGSGPDPCGGGGTCTIAGAGWTCSCPAGYVSTGAVQATCVDFNACDTAALADCTAATGNACVDEPPPSVTYHCTCGNAAFVAGTGTDGKPACVDKNECTPNLCRSGGDTAAACVDHVAPATGYDCTCSSAGWTVGIASGVTTCVDKDECAAPNPCANGTCTNVPAGGGYSCACAAGFVSTGGSTPTCIPEGAEAGAPDAGTGLDGQAPPPDAGDQVDGSALGDAAGSGASPGGDAGCSCRSAPARGEPGSALVALALALLGARRRARGARSRRT